MNHLRYLYTISVRETADGEITAASARLDLATRRMVPELLFTMVQPPEQAFTPGQLMCMAAAEALVRTDPLPLELPS